ncbi:DUF1697 domain-containing protein [bacterium]|nr:DUF1697 domain-containing protein [bacterium]
MPKNRPEIYVAVLRGINVGGKHRLAMKDLAAMFEDAGAIDVRTYIQSGNVVFRASEGVAASLPARVAAMIEERLGFRAPVVTRTAGEIDRIAKSNPYRAAGADPKSLHVVFLAGKPDASRVRALDPDRSPGDEYTVAGSVIYLLCPHGVARTKLTTDYFDAKLQTTSTTRNWNTVLKLRELAKE